MMELLTITGPIYLAILAGYLAIDHGLFTKADLQAFGKFTIKIALPALLLNALSKQQFNEILNWNYLAAYSIATLLAVGLALAWTYKVQKKSLSLSSMIAMGMCCSNSGFIGYPVILLIFGSYSASTSLALNMIVENLLIIPLLLACAENAHGNAQASEWAQRIRHYFINLISNPMIWGIACGFILSVFENHLPNMVSNTVTLFSTSSAALSLFVIGGSLSGVKLHGLKATIIQIAFGKLVLHPLILVFVLILLPPIQDMNLRLSVLLTCAMPMIGIYTVVAQRFGHETISAASSLVTTITSFFTITVLLWILKNMHFFGAGS